MASEVYTIPLKDDVYREEQDIKESNLPIRNVPFFDVSYNILHSGKLGDVLQDAVKASEVYRLADSE
ncbi:MAG: hypothetical protein GOV01_04005 [Candidatus Altiarchaeota archaeon]|nr:hypothetical protein [Candidatus Altiarchaeota archaeon]